MRYRRLGETGCQVSDIALGSWTTYGGSVAQRETTRIVRHAFDAGVNFFDTADVYIRGRAETQLGKALAGVPRHQVVIATKVMGRVWDGPLGAGLSRKHVFDAMDQSLRRLQVDYVDLYQAHAPDADTPLEETLRAFEDLVRAGKTRYIGFSNFATPLARTAVALQAMRQWDRFVSSQPRYNLLDRAVEKDHLAFCRGAGIGLIVYSPLAQGVLTNKYARGAVPAGSRAAGAFKHCVEGEGALTPATAAAAEALAAWAAKRGLPGPAATALAWVLRRKEVTSAIIGATSLAQLDENLRAGEVTLPAAEWRTLETAMTTAARAATRSATVTRRAAPRARR